MPKSKRKTSKQLATAVFVALRRGEIERPGACPECGAVTKLIATHPDPTKPLKIKWRCHRCHYFRGQKNTPPRTQRTPAPVGRRAREPARGRGRPPGARNRRWRCECRYWATSAEQWIELYRDKRAGKNQFKRWMKGLLPSFHHPLCPKRPLLYWEWLENRQR